MDDLNQSADLNELIDFLNDEWERREPTTPEEQEALYGRSEDLGAFLQEGGRLNRPLSSLLTSGNMSRTRSMPNYTIC